MAIPGRCSELNDERIPQLGWIPAGTSPFMTYESRTYRKSFGPWEATLTVSMYPDEQRKAVIVISAPPVSSR